MLFMSVFDYDPAKREEVVRKRVELGPPQRKGVKLVGQWSYMGGGKVVTLVDVETGDAEVLYELMMPYTNLGKFEVLPMIETEKILNMLRMQHKVEIPVVL